MATRKAPARNPAIPGTPTDRTGSAGILRRAVADIRRRFAGLQREVLAIFDGIRILEPPPWLPAAVNDASGAAPRTFYALTPDELAAVSFALQQALERWIANGRDPANLLWWAAYDAEAAQLGAAQTVANLTNLSAAYAATRTLREVVFSEAYRNRVAMAQVKSYEHWTGLTAGMRSELSQIIGRAVVDGKNPRAVRAEIMERLDVSKARAIGYAQTDITDTLRQARWAESDYARDELGVNTGLLHTSAFLPTTRQSHAARHGKVYTADEVREWYGRDGNRYRCFLPGTLVAGRFSAGIKSHYKGPAVRLVTAAGRELSVTANHPVLTARGMVPAAELREGDQLIAHRPEVQRALRVGDLDGGLIGAPVEEVFGALVQAGHQFPARVSPVDLHGDAAFVDPDVDVVRTERELVFALDPAAAKLLDDLAFVLPDAPRPARGDLQALIERWSSHSRGSVGGADVGLPLLGAELPHAVALGVAAVAQRHAGSREEIGQAATINAGGPADRQDGLAAVVEIDHVRELRLFEYEGHVFDLQERSGLMLGSNIVVSNCHCAQTECLLDAEGRPILTDALKATMAKERATWERAHPKG